MATELLNVQAEVGEIKFIGKDTLIRSPSPNGTGTASVTCDCPDSQMLKTLRKLFLAL